MPTLTGIHCAITIDILIRVSLVLTAGLVLTLTARRNAALRHATLVAGLVTASVVPAAMLTTQMLPVSRLQLGLLEWVRFDEIAAVAVASSRPPSAPHHPPASLDHPAIAVVATGGDEARPAPDANRSARLGERSQKPRAVNWVNAPDERSWPAPCSWRCCPERSSS